jgi:hypothetical protein
MSWLLDRLLIWIADVFDRNLLTLPELDDDWPRAQMTWGAGELDLAASAPIQLSRGRQSAKLR